VLLATQRLAHSGGEGLQVVRGYHVPLVDRRVGGVGRGGREQALARTDGRQQDGQEGLGRVQEGRVQVPVAVEGNVLGSLPVCCFSIQVAHLEFAFWNRNVTCSFRQKKKRLWGFI